MDSLQNRVKEQIGGLVRISNIETSALSFLKR